MDAGVADHDARAGRRRTPPGTETGELRVNRYLIEKGVDTQLVLYWYQSHGRIIASEYVSKFFLVRDAITLNRTDGSLVRVIVPISTQQAGGEAQVNRTAVLKVSSKRCFPS